MILVLATRVLHVSGKNVLFGSHGDDTGFYGMT